MKQKIYDFNTPDYEDELIANSLKHGGKLASGPDRRSLLYSLILVIAALASLLVVIGIVKDITLGSHPLQTFFSVIGALTLYPLFFSIRGGYTLTEVYVNFRNELRTVWRMFVWTRLLSLAAFFSALTFTLVRIPARYLPLSDATAIFITAFLGLFFFDMAGALAWLLHLMDGQNWNNILQSSVAFLSLDGFLNFLRCFAKMPPVVAFAAAIATLVVWLAMHVILLTVMAWGVTVVVLFMTALFAKKIERIYEPSSLPFTHLSDLHLTAHGLESIELGGVPNATVIEMIVECFHTPPLPVAITGDITDSGSRQEWQSFLEAVQSARQLESSVPILLAPGNHDLFPYARSFRPMISSLPLTSRLARLRKIRYLQAVLDTCPEMLISHDDGMTQPLGSWLQQHQTVIDSVVFSHVLAELSAIDRLWDSCFPMYCKVDQTTYVSLDTNRPHSNFWTSAFGQVNSGQRKRLAFLLNTLHREPDMKIVVLGHHHIYVPQQSVRKDWRLKHLEMIDGRSLSQMLSNSVDWYVHGHRHFEFSFKLEKMVVLSAASAKFGSN